MYEYSSPLKSWNWHLNADDRHYRSEECIAYKQERRGKPVKINKEEERMYEYSEECILTFLRNQSQLFAEPVAETEEEAEAFLEDCMAVVVDSLEEVRDYFDENGMDVEGMSLEELEDASEVFALPGGQYLIVEG